MVTKADRDTWAAWCISEYLDDHDEWSSDEVESIHCGVVHQVARKCDVRKRPPPEELDEYGCDASGINWHDWDEICSYRMHPIDPTDGFNLVTKLVSVGAPVIVLDGNYRTHRAIRVTYLKEYSGKQVFVKPYGMGPRTEVDVIPDVIGWRYP
jgi:hypothetical protein